MASEKLVMVPLDKIKPHPKNPRLVMREDVIESIAAQVKADGFKEKHAISVRPVDDYYQILSGHQRREAAKRAGLKEVPCWVEELDDDAAFMELVLANAQKELAPLEIGTHAFNAIQLGIGGRGKRGGLAAYAAAIGKGAPWVSMVRAAAEVLDAIKPFSQLNGLLECAQHLYELHAAPKSSWPALVDLLLAKEWNVERARTYAQLAKQYDDGDHAIPERWRFFLPLGAVIRHHFDTNERFSPQKVSALVAACVSTEEKISNLPSSTKHLSGFHEWLRSNTGGDAWDARAVGGYFDALLASLNKERLKLEDQWLQGSCLDHIGKLADESVSLVLTDPPYGMNYQSGFRKDAHKKIANDGAEAGDVVSDALRALMPKLAPSAGVFCFCHWDSEREIRAAMEAVGLKIKSSLIWVKNNTGMGDLNGSFAPKHERILYGVKGSPALYERIPDVIECARENTDRHPTEKPVELLKKLIEVTTANGQLVVDPFGGVASTLVAARDTERSFWGCELEADYHKIGMERLAQ